MFGNVASGSVINFAKGTEQDISFSSKPYTVIQPMPLERLIAPKVSVQDTKLGSRTTDNTSLSSNVKIGGYEAPKLFHQPAHTKTANPSLKSIQDLKPSLRSKSGRSKIRDEQKKSSSSNREMHNRLEKNRRALLKKCFDELALECELDPKKSSNLTVIRAAYKYVLELRRKERENEKELSNLVKDKIRKQQELEELKRNYPGVLEEEK